MTLHAALVWTSRVRATAAARSCGFVDAVVNPSVAAPHATSLIRTAATSSSSTVSRLLLRSAGHVECGSGGVLEMAAAISNRTAVHSSAHGQLLSSVASAAGYTSTAIQPHIGPSWSGSQFCTRGVFEPPARQPMSLVLLQGARTLQLFPFRTALSSACHATAEPAARCAGRNVSRARNIVGQAAGSGGSGGVSVTSPASRPRLLFQHVLPQNSCDAIFISVRGAASSSKAEAQRMDIRVSKTGGESDGGSGPRGAPGLPQKHVLYRGLGMVPFRLLVRFKVFQLAGVAAVVIPISTFLSQVCLAPYPYEGSLGPYPRSDPVNHAQSGDKLA